MRRLLVWARWRSRGGLRMGRPAWHRRWATPSEQDVAELAAVIGSPSVGRKDFRRGVNGGGGQACAPMPWAVEFSMGQA
eukprot:10903036-Alexandrium_andersonii.AAC.1